MSTPSETQTLTLQLGDIIQIFAPTNSTINDKIYLVDYIDDQEIKLVDTTTFETVTLNVRDGNISDESISRLDILDRPEEDGYARQHGLVTNTWIDAYFTKGDIPVVITGEITNVDEDMIEIKTFPEGKTIYIDFAYKGLPKNLPLEKIKIRERPAQLSREQKLSPVSEEEPGYIVRETPMSPTTTEVAMTSDDTVKAELAAFIANADKIKIGDDLGVITEVIELSEEHRRYGIDNQTNDLLDDLLSNVPMADRTREVLNKIHLQISRFKQLRSLYSEFDEFSNITGMLKHGADYKPLVKHMQDLDVKLPWILPVAMNRKKIYNIDADEIEELTDIVPLTLAESRIAEAEITETYATNSMPSGENKLDYLYRSLNPYLTPFEASHASDVLIANIPVGANQPILLDNTRDDFNSITVGNDVLHKFQYLITNYTVGLTRLEQDKDVTTPGEYKTMVVPLTSADTVNLKSFLLLPESAILFSQVVLPGSNIMLKSNLSQHYLNYWEVLNDQTFVNSVIIDEFETTVGDKFKAKKVIGEDQDRFTRLTEYICNEDIDDPDKFNKFLQTIIPRTKELFNLFKPYISGMYSLYAIVRVLEPFLVYYHDLTYKQYDEMAEFLSNEIHEYKNSLLQKGREFNAMKLIRYNVKYKVSSLVSGFKDNQPLLQETFEAYGIITPKTSLFGKERQPLSTSEMLFRMLKSDNVEYYSNVVAFTTLPLHLDVDIDSLLRGDKAGLTEKMSQETVRPCSRYVIAKSYGSLSELEIDNDNPRLTFDSDRDETRYDILKEYKAERASMTPEEFQPFLVTKLRETIGLNLEDATRDADAMVRGKRLVQDGDLAVVPVEIESGTGNFAKVVFERVNNKWQRTELDSKVITDDKAMVCNVNQTCFKINQQCLNNELAVDEIKRQGIESMLKEFDDQYSYSTAELNAHVSFKLERSKQQLPKIHSLREIEDLKYNRMRYKLGVNVVEGDIIVSPYAAVRDLIMGQSDIIKRNADIVSFVSRYCRTALDEENTFWYYCVRTDTKLLPVFVHELAQAFNTQQNANDFSIYTRTLDIICNEQGVISDDGNAYVDKHSGYEICPIELDEEEGYEASGYKRISRAQIEAELGNLVYGDPTGVAKQELDNPDAQTVKNVTTTMANFMGIEISAHIDFIIRNTLLVLSQSLSSEEEHNKKVALRAKQGKKLPSFADVKSASILLLTLGSYLIAIQTSIPPIRTRKTFPGCTKSFSGFPLQGDADLSALNYIACVAHKLKSSVQPWNAIKGLSEALIAKKVKDLVTSVMLSSGSVKEKITQKLEYLTLNESEFIPLEHDIGTWINFLPPFRLSQMEVEKPLSKEAESTLISHVRQGSKKQTVELMAIEGKIVYHSYEIQVLIQEIISKQAPLLSNAALEPFLVNSCCNESDMISTIGYFSSLNSDIPALNERVKLLQYMVNDMRFYTLAPLLNDPRDTRERFPQLSNEFSEDTIYRAFIVFCKYNNNLPLEPELLRICTDKPKQFDKYDDLSSQIENLKQSGKTFTNESLQQLLQVINARNTFIPDITIESVTTVQEIQNLLVVIRDADNTVVSPEFVELFTAALDTYDIATTEDSDSMRAFKNFLAQSSDTLTRSIVEFLSKYSSVSKPALSSVITLIENLDKWSVIRDSIFLSSTDNTMYGTVDFITNMLKDIIDVFPTIILNKVNYDSIKIPKHWKVSDRHETDIKKFVERYYTKLKRFYANNIIRDFLEKVSEDGEIYLKLCSATPALATLPDGSQKPLFDAELTTMLYKYYALNTIYQFVLLTDSPQFVRQIQPAIALALDEQMSSKDELLLERLDTESISAVEIVRGESLQLKEQVASLLYAMLSNFSDTKQTLDLNYDQVMERVLRAKEKEKDLITKFLRDLTDEERELENVFKNNKLERWSKGLQKGVTQYVKDTYDEERDQMDAQIRLERRAGENNVVTNMNLNIYALEMEDADRIAQEITDDVYDRSAFPDDDDYGNRDGDEGY